MYRINEKISQAVKQCGIKVRPNTAPGLWMFVLVPTSVILSAVKHPRESTQTYKLSAVHSVGLLLTPITFFIICLKRKDMNKTKNLHLIPGAMTAWIYFHYFNRGFLFSSISGFMSATGYYKFFLFVMQVCPLSFSIGEATIVAQGITLFTFATFLNIYNAFFNTPYKILDVATLIIQIGLFTIGVVCWLSYKYSRFRKAGQFYVMSVVVIVALLILPLHVLLQKNPLVWIFDFITRDSNTLKVMVYWIVCTLAAVMAVRKQITEAKKASTIIRKTFHLLAFSVYLPGLIYDCTLLFIASGVALGIFIALELLRILNVPPIGQGLQDGFMVFCDEKDAGAVALTPIYLLIGCSLPVWLHPAPCDMTNSAGYYLLPLISGLLSVGIGDTAASIFGTLFGKHRWPGSKKTVEGTLACIISQMLIVAGLVHFGLILRSHQLLYKSAVAIIVVSLVEAKTNQVDNLILPMLMYNILIF